MTLIVINGGKELLGLIVIVRGKGLFWTLIVFIGDKDYS